MTPSNPMRALIIDDDAGTRRIISLVLGRDFGAEIVEADNGLEALGRLDEGERFDLLVLDLQMPVMDGLETLEAVRRSPLHAEVPVLVLTGEAGARAVRQVLALGISSYLTKPVNIGKLSSRIASALGRGAPSPGQAPTGDPAPPDEPIAEPERTVLVVDGDASLGAAVAEALRGRARVVECPTGSRALHVLLADGGANPPQAVVIGPAIGVLDSDLLARKIRRLPLAATPWLVGAFQADQVAARRDSKIYDRVVGSGATSGQLAEQLEPALK